MENARFYVDFCYEAGSDEYGANVSGRYQFAIDLTDEEYEELYQIWYDQNELNSWSTIWDGHDNLYQKINDSATIALSLYIEIPWTFCGSYHKKQRALFNSISNEKIEDNARCCGIAKRSFGNEWSAR